MHQVVRDVDAVERLLEAFTAQRVAAHDRQLGLHARWLAGKRAQLVSSGMQARDQQRADEATGASDENAHPHT